MLSNPSQVSLEICLELDCNCTDGVEVTVLKIISVGHKATVYQS